MNINDAIASKYLKASDIGEEGDTMDLVIKAVEFEDVGKDKTENKLVVYFRDKEKALILNVTNLKRIAKMYGEETDDWPGKTITLFATETEFAGETVACIRVRSGGKAKSSAAAPSDAPAPAPSDAPAPAAASQVWTKDLAWAEWKTAQKRVNSKESDKSRHLSDSQLANEWLTKLKEQFGNRNEASFTSEEWGWMATNWPSDIPF